MARKDYTGVTDESICISGTDKNISFRFIPEPFGNSDAFLYRKGHFNNVFGEKSKVKITINHHSNNGKRLPEEKKVLISANLEIEQFWMFADAVKIFHLPMPITSFKKYDAFGKDDVFKYEVSYDKAKRNPWIFMISHKSSSKKINDQEFFYLDHATARKIVGFIEASINQFEMLYHNFWKEGRDVFIDAMTNGRPIDTPISNEPDMVEMSQEELSAVVASAPVPTTSTSASAPVTPPAAPRIFNLGFRFMSDFCEVKTDDGRTYWEANCFNPDKSQSMSMRFSQITDEIREAKDNGNVINLSFTVKKGVGYVITK